MSDEASGKYLVDPAKNAKGVDGHIHKLWSAVRLDVNELITTFCRSMTIAGVPVRQQVETLWAMGFGIGQGGPGGTGSATEIECPYCGQTGNGGHGGFCPNMGKDRADWISNPV
jgi:hypothetical protein